jgi:hypothetical protein
MAVVAEIFSREVIVGTVGMTSQAAGEQHQPALAEQTECRFCPQASAIRRSLL